MVILIMFVDAESQQLFEISNLDGEDVQSIRSEMSDGELDLDFDQVDTQMDLYVNNASMDSVNIDSEILMTRVADTTNQEGSEGSEELVQTTTESSQEIVNSENAGGRNKATIWSNFETKKDMNGKILSNQCKKCWKPVSAKACRKIMVDHISYDGP